MDVNIILNISNSVFAKGSSGYASCFWPVSIQLSRIYFYFTEILKAINDTQNLRDFWRKCSLKLI